MLFILIALFVIAPFVEIYVLIKAGQVFGAPMVIFGTIATAIIGGILLRIQGLSALNKAQRAIRDGKVPVESAVDGVLLLVAAPFLMTPGFLTDGLGFLLLVPAIRRLIGRMALRRLKRQVDEGKASIHISHPPR